jgi:uncharacterized protein (TIGR02453 family)
MAGPFAGFPRESTTFFVDLARHNNREWFQAHKEIYELACREPMQALAAEFEPLGPTRISRINRDMRFSRDGKPYKTYIAMGLGKNYVSLSAGGLYVGTGIYKPEPVTLQRFRAAVAEDASGRALVRIVTALRRKGYRVDTHESLASAPRGFTADHPRIGLLRMKDIHAGRMFPPSALAARTLVARVSRAMDDIEPLAAWIGRYVN